MKKIAVLSLLLWSCAPIGEPVSDGGAEADAASVSPSGQPAVDFDAGTPPDAAYSHGDGGATLSDAGASQDAATANDAGIRDADAGARDAGAADAGDASPPALDAGWVPAWTYTPAAGWSLFYEGMADASGNLYAYECPTCPTTCNSSWWGAECAVCPAPANPCRLLSLSPAGTVRLSVPLPTDQKAFRNDPRPIALGSNAIYVGGPDNKVFAYSTSDGRKLFETAGVGVVNMNGDPEDSGFVYPAAIAAGTRGVYYAPTTKLDDFETLELRSISPSNGSPLWTSAKGFCTGSGGAAIEETDRGVLARATGGHYSGPTGYWDAQGNKVTGSISGEGTIAFRFGDLVFSTNDSSSSPPWNTDVHDLGTGKRAYGLHFSVSGGVGGATAYLTGAAYYDGPDFSFWLAAIDARTGAIRWESRFDDQVGAPYLLANGDVLTVGWTMRGEIIRRFSPDGHLLGTYSSPERWEANTIVLENGLWIGADSRRYATAIRAYKVQGLDLADHGWVCPHGNLQRNDRPLP